jgi:large repetitive protein
MCRYKLIQKVRTAAAILLQFIFSACLLWVALDATILYAAPPAGSTIENQAIAKYFDTDYGFNSTVFSNTVRVTVQPLEAVLLTQDQTVIRAAGSVVRLPHRLTNTGNVRSAYTLRYTNLAGDNFDLPSPVLVRDLNANGTADPGEPVLLNGESISLDAGEVVDLVITSTLQSTISTGSTALFELTATSALQNVRAINTDRVIIGEGASFQVSKTTSNQSPKPGDIVNFSLTASNTGNRTAVGIPIQIDGVAASYVVLRDVIPSNMTFSALGAGGVAIGLYHLQGAPEHSYATVVPADFSLVDAVAFAFTPIAQGLSVSRNFAVRVNSNASGPVKNIGQMLFNDGVHAAPAAIDSNVVWMSVPVIQPDVQYYGSSTYANSIRVAHLGMPAYVQAIAAQCNLDPLVKESRQIIISSALTGDQETFLATETGPNTGVFRISPNIQIVDVAIKPAVTGDGVISSKKDDKLLAVLPGCGAAEVSADLLIDPYGLVFDSKTNAAVPRAVVSLIDVTGQGNGGYPGGLALVFQADGVSPAPNVYVTDAAGHYEFPQVKASTYRLVVQPTPTYSYPSILAPALLPAGHVIDTSGSYGGSFAVNVATNAVQLDIPLDASASSGIFLEKTAARQTVELGEFLDYTLKLKNTSGQLLGRLLIDDQLPAGFAYQPNSARINGGTTRLNGTALPEPDGGIGPKLTFHMGSLEDGATLTLTYRVRIGPGAMQGDGINRAQASSAGPLVKHSNQASVAVQVLPGVFSSRAYLIGKVYADCNNNGLQDDGEPGIPGVRLFIEDGTYVITDGQGKYSLYGLRPQTHVLKVDSTTLPSGSQLAILSNRNAGDANSRFVDLKNSELHKADFALAGCSVQLKNEIESRIAQLSQNTEAESLVKTRLTTEPQIIDVKAQPASGILGKASIAVPLTAKHPISKDAIQANVIDATATTVNEAQVAAWDNTVHIMAPTDKQILPTAQTRVVVKGQLGARFELSINGNAVNATRVGKRSKLEDKQLEVWEYIGVDLKAGPNVVEVVQFDSFDNRRGSHSLTVSAPGSLAVLQMQIPKNEQIADGKTKVKVSLTLADADGLAITARTPVTLTTSAGEWLNEDLNKDEPGTQIFVEDGKAELVLLPPVNPGYVRLSATAGTITSQAEISLVPELRPLLAVGIVEGVLNLRRLDSKALTPTRAQDSFEQELQHFSYTNDGKAEAGARAALYLKGKVKGDYLLTLAYDSNKDVKETLFRDIQPEEYYPVYGDSSMKGFDAQSTSRLYVRVDHGQSHVMYGDFSTQAAQQDALSPRLGNYNRSLTGAKWHQESGLGRLDGFVSRNNSRQVVDELAARGVSGPYILSHLPYLQNSERIEIITRSRDQESLIIKTLAQSRFSDYAIEPLTGRILFKGPIPTYDTDLNPNFVRVSYEVEQGGIDSWVYGISGQTNSTNSIILGGAWVKDHNLSDPFDLISTHLGIKLDDKTRLIAETAQTKTLDSGIGHAHRIELKREDGNLQVQASVVQSDSSFKNPSASIAAGRTEAGAKLSYKIDEVNQVKAEYAHTKDEALSGVREGVSIAIEHSFESNLRAEIGLRNSKQSEIPATSTNPSTPLTTFTSVRLKLAGQISGLSQASLYGEAEQDIGAENKHLAALGGDYKLANGGRLYGRHEFISSLGNHYSLNSNQQRNLTVLGADTSYMQGGQLFSEYRLRDALTGREAEAAMGLRNTWRVSEGLAFQTGFERVHAFNGASNNESVSVNGGVEYSANPDWKTSARLELRSSPTSDSLLGTVGIATKLDKEWTLLSRDLLSISRSSSAADKTQNRLQVGLAYRDLGTNVWNGLMRLEHRYEKTSELTGLNSKRNIVITAAHMNYQPSRPITLSSYYASKWACEKSNGLNSSYNLHLLGARATYEVAADWDLGISLFTQFSGDYRSRHEGFGSEVGHKLTRNLWLAGGYNWFGFHDADLGGSLYTNPGVYLRLRLKFDEQSF